MGADDRRTPHLPSADPGPGPAATDDASLAWPGRSTVGAPRSGGPWPAAPPTADDAPRYEAGGRLGLGGMGEVRIARDTVLDRDVALKTPRRPEDADALLAEARVTARLEHPSILPIYDAGRGADGGAWYATRVLSGRSLADALDARPALADRLKLVRHLLAVAQAVGYAHAAGVLHRDLKPANVMIGRFGETVVADWGLATAAAGAVSDRAGTPGFMAPEQAAGAPIDGRADVYAVGAMLHLVTRGALPGRPATLDGAPPALVAIARRATAARPDDRYPSMAALADDLEAWLDGRPVHAHAYTSAERIGRFVQRWRAPLVVATLGLGLTTAAAAVGWWRTAAERDRARDAEQEATRARQLSEEHLARALVARAREAADDERPTEAMVLAAQALQYGPSAEARGVLARFGGRPLPVPVPRGTMPDCLMRAVSSDGLTAACQQATRVLTVDLRGPPTVVHAQDVAAAVIAVTDGGAVVAYDAQGALLAWRPGGPGTPVAGDPSAPAGSGAAMPGGRPPSAPGDPRAPIAEAPSAPSGTPIAGAAPPSAPSGTPIRSAGQPPAGRVGSDAPAAPVGPASRPASGAGTVPQNEPPSSSPTIARLPVHQAPIVGFAPGRPTSGPGAGPPSSLAAGASQRSNDHVALVLAGQAGHVVVGPARPGHAPTLDLRLAHACPSPAGLADDGADGVIVGCIGGEVVRARPGSPPSVVARVAPDRPATLDARGDRIAVGTTAGELLVLDDGQLTRRVRLGRSAARAVALTDGYAAVLLEEGTLSVVDLSTGAAIVRVSAPQVGLAWLADGRTLRAVGAEVVDWPLPDPGHVQRVPFAEGLSALAVDPGGAWAVAGTGDGAVRAVDLRDGRTRFTLPGDPRFVPKDLALSADRIAVARSGTTPQLLVTADGAPLPPWHDLGVRRVGFVGEALLAMGYDGRLLRIDPADGAWRSTELAHLDAWEADLQPGGSALLTTGGEVWTVDGPAVTLRTTVPGTRAVARIGDDVLTAGPDGVRRHRADGGVDGPWPVVGDPVELTASHHGRWVVVGTLEGVFEVLDAATGASVAVLRGHRARGNLARFTADDGWLVTGSWDRDLRVWHTADLERPVDEVIAGVSWAVTLADVLGWGR